MNHLLCVACGAPIKHRCKVPITARKPRRQVHTNYWPFSAQADADSAKAKPPQHEVHKDGVVICGGGPAGLAAALLLARRGWKDITIVEKKDVIGAEDSQRSYVYMIDGRGRKLLSRFPGMVESLDEYGVSTAAINIMRALPSGEIKESDIAIKDPKRVSHFMPRPAFLKLLIDKGLQQEWAQAANIRLLTSTEVTDIITQTKRDQQPEQLPPVCVKAVKRNGGQEEVIEMRPRLLIAADGQSSMVRTTLQAWEQDSAQTGQEEGGNRFAIKESPSDAAGLRYKILKLPPNPVVMDCPDCPPLTNPSFAILVGKALGLGSSLKGLRLGMLPVRDPNGHRLANLITKPDHKVWEANTAEELYAMFEKSMPQIRFRELVPHDVMEQFASSKGGRFPNPSCCEGLQYIVPGVQHASSSNSSSSSSASDSSVESSSSQSGAPSSVAPLPPATGILLIGDARASFPPDLGQGVNSALEDVDELAQVLEAHNDDILTALPVYEQRRAPDVAALIQLMTFCFPWQYNQDPIKKFFWTINFAARGVFNKILPAIFSPHSFMLVQVSSLSYRQVLEQAHATTQRLTAFIGILAVALVAFLKTGGPAKLKAAVGL